VCFVCVYLCGVYAFVYFVCSYVCFIVYIHVCDCACVHRFVIELFYLYIPFVPQACCILQLMKYIVKLQSKGKFVCYFIELLSTVSGNVFVCIIIIMLRPCV